MTPMTFSDLSHSSNPGSANKPNEDLAIVERGLMVMLDGATGLGPDVADPRRSDAHWLVHALQQAIRDKRASCDVFPRLIKSALMEVTQAYYEKAARRYDRAGDIPAYALPACSMVAVMQEGSQVMAYGIGDCELLLRKAGREETHQIFTRHPVHAAIDEASAASYGAYRQQGMSHEAAREAITDQLRQGRMKMNQPDGYPVLSVDLRCLNDLQSVNLTEDYDLSLGDQLFLCTDGVSALYQEYRAMAPHEVFDHEANILIRMLRMIEQGDSEITRYPRLKVSDDATLLRATLRASN